MHVSEEAVYSAMRENRFCFYLQPDVNLKTGKIVSAEVVAKYIDAEGRQIPLNEFLDTVDEREAVVGLDYFICRRVCIFLAERINKKLSVMCISVHLSSLHFHNQETACELHAIASEYHIPPELLGFKISEPILSEDYTKAKQLANQLRSYGHPALIGEQNNEGIYVSQPILPEEFWNTFERQQGKYPASEPSVSSGPEQKAYKSSGIHKLFQFRSKQYLLTIILSAVFLGICITAVLNTNRRMTQQEFTRMVTETLNAYTDGQRENTLKEIEGVTSTLDSLAVLIQRNDDPDFIDAYLMALNEDNSEIDYQYSTEADYNSMFESGENRENDSDTMERLKQGETVVTDITRSSRLGDIYCIGIGVPVIKEGKFIGAVRGIIHAEELVSTDLYDPAQGEIVAAFLTDSDSVILPIRDEKGRGVGEQFLKRLNTYGIEDKILAEIKEAFSLKDLHARSIRLGLFDSTPYYISITGLKYNDWHLVVCLKADRASAHLQYVVRTTVYGILALLVAVLLVTSILIISGGKLQKKFTLEEQRYLLLERFSDTVLFDYDFIHDTIRFTSNAFKFLRIHDLLQVNFLGKLNQIYIYAGDLAAINTLLGGKLEDLSGELRVRLMRPNVDEFFWCLVQYQYLYEKGELASIIGKITDIDEQMRHENYLLRMSETDGLTGLLNKTASEKQVMEKLKYSRQGTLFVMDVDNFKQINDRYGHAAGDRALEFIGQCLQSTFRKNDILGRIGGDELLVYVDGFSNHEFSKKKTELLAKHLEENGNTGVSSCSISIGTAYFPSDGNNYQDLFHAADQAMYTAKKRGIGQLCIFEEICGK